MLVNGEKTVGIEDQEPVEPVEPAEAPATEPAQEPESDSPEQAFEQGYREVSGEQPAEPVEPAPQPEPEPVKIAGYTEKELEEILGPRLNDQRKALESMNGRFGALNQQVQDIKAKRGNLTVKDEDFAKLKEDYPEFTEALIPVFRAIIERQPAPEPSPPQPPEGESKGMTAEEVSYLQSELAKVHPDWREVAVSPAFIEWKKTASSADRYIMDNAWDAAATADVLTRFKQSQTTSRQSKQARLEAAVTPKGVQKTTPAKTDQDYFNEGFNLVARR